MRLDETAYRILIIEDNPGDFLLVEDFLSEHIQKPELIHVKNYKEARIQIDSSDNSWDIILLDLSLPDITKEQLIEETSTISQYCPVIILTGYSDLDFATRSLSQGVSDYLIKDTISPLVLYKSILYSIERHRFIQSLRESEKRYMDIFHISPAPIWVYDLKTLNFMDVNEAAVRHYGFSKEEFLSMTLREIRPEEDIPILEATINESIENPMHFFKGVFNHKKKNGEVINVEITSNPIHFNGRQAEIVLATDITEKLIHMTAVEKQNIKLREIAWTQSHVLRAPVARLMGLVDLIKSGNLSSRELSEMLEHINTSAKEIDEVIRGIVSKSQSVMNFSKSSGNDFSTPHRR